MSVGQLIAMSANARRAAVARLSPAVRIKLARLATLGIAKQMVRISEYTEVLEELTRDDDERVKANG